MALSWRKIGSTNRHARGFPELDCVEDGSVLGIRANSSAVEQVLNRLLRVIESSSHCLVHSLAVETHFTDDGILVGRSCCKCTGVKLAGSLAACG